MIIWRIFLLASLSILLGSYYFLEIPPKVKRLLFEFAMGLGALFTYFLVSYFSGLIPQNLITYIIGTALIFPFATVIQISRSLKFRIIITIGYVCLSHIGMVLGTPEILLSGSNRIPFSIFVISILWNLGTALITITGGHFIHRLYKYSVFLSEDLEEEKEHSEKLLRNILPEKVSTKLKRNEEISEQFENVTVLFADIVDFTSLARKLPAHEVVSILDNIFTNFDDLVNDYHLEKIKTIGDEYFVAAGVPDSLNDPALRMAHLAFDLRQEIESHERDDGTPFKLRIGMNTGPLVAGIIGKEKFVYDVWGDTVNVGSRMESQGISGEIQVTPETKQAIQEQDSRDEFSFKKRATITVKGKGEITTYLLKKESIRSHET